MKGILRKRAKLGNKGFSMVEMIIVIAIMAILVGVIGLSLTRYVRSARISSDEQLASEIKTAVQTALASDDVYKEVQGKAISNVELATVMSSTDYTALASEITQTVGSSDDIHADLKHYTGIYITVSISDGGNTLDVYAGDAPEAD